MVASGVTSRVTASDRILSTTVAAAEPAVRITVLFAVAIAWARRAILTIAGFANAVAASRAAAAEAVAGTSRASLAGLAGPVSTASGSRISRHTLACRFVTGFNSVAGVAVVANDRRKLAARSGIARIRGASNAVVTSQRRARDALAGAEIARFSTVAHIEVVAFGIR